MQMDWGEDCELQSKLERGSECFLALEAYTVGKARNATSEIVFDEHRCRGSPIAGMRVLEADLRSASPTYPLRTSFGSRGLSSETSGRRGGLEVEGQAC
eukprot:14308699-Alexandrium_andersonii.AAC.1